MNEQNTVASEPQKEIPPLPGGGSWTFDEASWAWISNDPAPVPEVQTAPDQTAPAAAAAPTDVQAAEQPASEE
jgi:hypothetical protein